MSDLRRIPLSETAEVNPPRVAHSLTPESDVSFIGMSDVSESGHWVNRQTRQVRQVSSGFTAFREGDVLVAKITPCMENGKGCHATGLVSQIGFGSTEFHVLRSRSGHDDRLLFHWTQSPALRLKAEAFMIGSAGQQRVQKEFFDKFLVEALPLLEQQLIAQILDTVDEVIRRTEEVIAKLQQMKQGLLHDLLTRGIDDNGELRDPDRHPEHFKDSELGRIPREWEVGPLRVLSELQVGYAFRSEWFSDVDGVPLLRGENVGYGAPNWAQTKRLPERHARRFSEYMLHAGDVIIGMDRTFTKSGVKVSVLGSSDAPALLVQRVGRFVPTEVADRQFVLQLLGWSGFHRKLLAQEKGMDIPHLSKTEILTPLVPIPSRSEQTRMAESLASCEEAVFKEQSNQAKLRLLKTGLMDDLLTGQVRVTDLLKLAPPLSGGSAAPPR